MMALRGIRVLEFAGLAPVPFCGMILADFGATVTRIDRVNRENVVDVFSRGKRSLKLDLKHRDGVTVAHRLSMQSDVVIEPFRPGVMESLGLGPCTLCRDNPRLIYTRLTGYGQTGRLAKHAGHDINYIAMSGVLSCLGRSDQKPHAPVNLLADFAGGGLMAAMGIVMAIHERSRSHKGQVIDASMVDGSAYVASFLWRSQHLPLWTSTEPGTNILDGGAFFYDTYETKDGRHMAVGALEPQFFEAFMKGLGLDPEVHHPGSDSRDIVTQIFLTKTRDEWTEIFHGQDCCVTPVLDLDEATGDQGNDRTSFIHRDDTHHVTAHNHKPNNHGKASPAPAPKLSRTPARTEYCDNITCGSHSVDILKEIGFSSEEIKGLLDSGVVQQTDVSKL